MEAIERYERKLSLKATSTQRNYRYAINKFLLKNSMTLEQLIELAQGSIEDIELLVAETMKSAVEVDHYRPTTARLIYKAVRFFLKAAGVKGFELDPEDQPRGKSIGPVGVTREHLEEIYDSFSPFFKTRNRAILMFMKDSGLRVSDVARMTAEMYWEAEEEIINGERFRVFNPFDTKKTGDVAHIRIGPEAIKAIEEYLKSRKTGPLFIADDAGKHKGGGIKSEALSEIFINLKSRRQLKLNYKKVSAHSMRKFHFTTLQHLGADFVYYLQGKATDTYFSNPAQVTLDYANNYDRLRVFTTASVKEKERDQKLSDLVHENEQLRERLEDIGREQRERASQQAGILDRLEDWKRRVEEELRKEDHHQHEV